jgi:hypothetical protein
VSTKDLQSLINELRDLANDGDAALFDDPQATDWLNEGANHFCLETQILRFPIKQPTTQDINEYPLPYDEGDIISVSYHDGSQSFPLEEVRPDEVNIGTRQTANRPVGYYIRQSSAWYQSKSTTDSSDVFTFFGPEYKYVLGVWPIPADSLGELTIWMSIEHPRMEDPADLCLIPFRFQFAPVAYACYKAKLKEQAQAEADIFAKTFDALTDKAVERQISKASNKPRSRRRTRETRDPLDYTRRWLED